MDSDEGPDHGRLSDEIDSPGGVRLTETQLLQAEAEVDISERVLRYILMPSFSDLSEYVSGGRLESVCFRTLFFSYRGEIRYARCPYSKLVVYFSSPTNFTGWYLSRISTSST